MPWPEVSGSPVAMLTRRNSFQVTVGASQYKNGMWYRTAAARAQRKADVDPERQVWDPAHPDHEFVRYPDNEWDEEDLPDFNAYQSPADLIRGLQEGRLLMHARRPDDRNYQHGLYPGAGDLLKSTEGWQFAQDEHGSGPELTFFSDNLDWVKTPRDLLVFVRKHPTIQQSLGMGRVRLHDDTEMPYERSPMADYEDPNFRGEPAGVEVSDWYTNQPQNVVGTIRRRSMENR